MKIAALMLSTLLVAGCTGAIQPNTETRLDSELAVLDFNDSADAYLERPTFVSLVERYGSGKMLSIKVDLYGTDSHLYVPLESSADVTSMIDKYLSWQETATERGDQIEKEISTVDGWGAFKLKGIFFSGGVGRHFLVINQCAMGCIGASSEDYFYFDKSNAQHFKKLIHDMQSGRLKMLDVDSIYK